MYRVFAGGAVRHPVGFREFSGKKTRQRISFQDNGHDARSMLQDGPILLCYLLTVGKQIAIGVLVGGYFHRVCDVRDGNRAETEGSSRPENIQAGYKPVQDS